MSVTGQRRWARVEASARERREAELPVHGAALPALSDALSHGRQPYAPQTMSHALLLRLFLSPSFFSVHVALQYLRIYADNIGVTYYLTRRLRELDTRELREVWGFVW